MQRVNCTVRLGGQVGNTVAKENVTAAEIAILLAIHGEGSVVDIQPIQMCKTPHGQERQRLAEHYGAKIVDAIFPGQFARLPVTLKEVPGLSEVEGGTEAVEDEEEDDLPPLAGSDEAILQASEPVTEAAFADDVDDAILRQAVADAKSKSELYQLAKDNDVDLKAVPDKMDDLKAAILDGVFGKADA